VDDLCAVPDFRIDDKGLLAAPSASAKGTPRKSPRAKDSRRDLKFPPEEPYEGGPSEIARFGQLFSPVQALDTALDTVKHFIGALSLDLISEIRTELGAHVQRQVSKIVAAVDVARAVCVNHIVPQMESQRESVRFLTELHSAEKYLKLRCFTVRSFRCRPRCAAVGSCRRCTASPRRTLQMSSSFSATFRRPRS